MFHHFKFDFIDESSICFISVFQSVVPTVVRVRATREIYVSRMLAEVKFRILIVTLCNESIKAVPRTRTGRASPGQFRFPHRPIRHRRYVVNYNNEIHATYHTRSPAPADSTRVVVIIILFVNALVVPYNNV